MISSKVGVVTTSDRSGLLAWIAHELGASEVHSAGSLQPLWAGYGDLFRIHVIGGPVSSAVVKWARPPRQLNDTSARRKRQSFDVESTFYRTVAPQCGSVCRVPRLLAARGGEQAGEWVLVLEDLDAAGYTRRIDEPTGAALEAALRWLANFHARFLGEYVDGLWPVGTYWHLDTRLEELPAIEDSSLRHLAPRIAERLAGGAFATLVHGDAKDANFCFTPDGAEVAALDFQYVGRGCPMSDLAYLLYGRSDEPDDGLDHARLDAYFSHLHDALARRHDADEIDVRAVESEWRRLYPVARLDFCRFLAGWRPAMWRHDRSGQYFVRLMAASCDW